MFAVLLLATAIFVGFGPGFLMLSVLGAAGFLLATPALQFLLMRAAYFKARPVVTAMIGVGIVVIGIVLAIVSGRFFFW
jgi:multisubunit Na+/H+ antiporter MnhG subunit